MAKLDFAKGVEVLMTGTTNWAKLTEATGPDKLSEKYQVDLTVDEKTAKELEAMKIASFLNCKAADGTPKYEELTVRLKTNKAPQLWDTAKQPYTGLIGNGSVLRAKTFIKSWEMAGKKGLTAYINKGVIIDLVDYDGADDDDLWEDVPVSDGMPDAAPTSAPTPTAAQAFEEEDDDLPF